jgi:hypothetical protein
MPDPITQSMLQSLQTPESGKIVSAEEAVRLIRDGDTIATGGFVGIGFAEGIAVALETLYFSTEERHLQAIGKPRNLTLVYAADRAMARSGGSITSVMRVWFDASWAGIGGWCLNCSDSLSLIRSRHTIFHRASSPISSVT